ncbi:Hypothetical predicted protein [Marmota monax]|uniref:Uncharacterized protein n=1 Tax=Marmota monax TaxID=9995 RepID=A0A5E4BED9_MARMO|nr:hypothetical protein GHT09_000145 [Marmota monax]VTJ67705.1 Hypothetical predicted protein [Marmota monax]
MLRALTLLRPWRPLGVRGCTSDGTSGGHEIQVRALAGPDQAVSRRSCPFLSAAMNLSGIPLPCCMSRLQLSFVCLGLSSS